MPLALRCSDTLTLASAGPTNFEPVIRHITMMAKERRKNAYNVLLILTGQMPLTLRLILPCALHLSSCLKFPALHPAPYLLHTPYTLHPVPCTPHPTPSARALLPCSSSHKLSLTAFLPRPTDCLTASLLCIEKVSLSLSPLFSPSCLPLPFPL